jgi:hypothetical protein
MAGGGGGGAGGGAGGAASAWATVVVAGGVAGAGSSAEAERAVNIPAAASVVAKPNPIKRLCVFDLIILGPRLSFE